MKTLTTTLAALLISSSANALPGFDESVDCSQPSNQYERNNCIGRSVNDSEFQLTQVYRQLRTAFKNDKQREATLVQAQRAWIAWRDKESDLCAQAQGIDPIGSGYGAVYGSCKASLNKQRVEDLRRVLRWAIE